MAVGTNKSEFAEPFKFDIYEVRDDMSNKEYHSRDEISSSFVKTVHKHSVGAALTPINQNAPALLFGDAFHEYMELGELSDRFAIKPEKGDLILDEETGEMVESKAWDGRTSEGKKWNADNKHKIILTQEELTHIKGMYDSVMRHPIVARLFNNPDIELRHEWSFFADGDCKFTKGLQFRVRPDLHAVRKSDEKLVAIFDWKSTNDLKKLIKWNFLDLGYDVQDVFYADMLMVPVQNFYFINVEKTPPYSCRVITISEDTAESAREKMARALDRIREWQEDPTKIDIDLPDVIEI